MTRSLEDRIRDSLVSQVDVGLPPMRTADEIVHRGRVARTRRAAMASAAAVVTVVATIGLVTLVAPAGNDSGPTPAASGSLPPGVEPTASPPPDPAIGKALAALPKGPNAELGYVRNGWIIPATGPRIKPRLPATDRAEYATPAAGGWVLRVQRSEATSHPAIFAGVLWFVRPTGEATLLTTVAQNGYAVSSDGRRMAYADYPTPGRSVTRVRIVQLPSSTPIASHLFTSDSPIVGFTPSGILVQQGLTGLSPGGLALWNPANNRVTTISSADVRYLVVGLDKGQSTALARAQQNGAQCLAVLKLGEPVVAVQKCPTTLVPQENGLSPGGTYAVVRHASKDPNPTGQLFVVRTDKLDGSIAALPLPAGALARIITWTGPTTAVIDANPGMDERGTLVRCNVVTRHCERAGTSPAIDTTVMRSYGF